MASSSPCRSWPLQTCHPIGSSLLLQLPLQPASDLSPSSCLYKKFSSYNRCKTKNRVLYAWALRICAIGLSNQQLFYGNKIEDIVVTIAWHVSYKISVSSIYKVDIPLPLANSLTLWSSSSRRTVRASLMLLGRIGEHHPHFSAKALQATIIPGQSDKSCRCRCWL